MTRQGKSLDPHRNTSLGSFVFLYSSLAHPVITYNDFVHFLAVRLCHPFGLLIMKHGRYPVITPLTLSLGSFLTFGPQIP